MKGIWYKNTLGCMTGRQHAAVCVNCTMCTGTTESDVSAGTRWHQQSLGSATSHLVASAGTRWHQQSLGSATSHLVASAGTRWQH